MSSFIKREQATEIQIKKNKEERQYYKWNVVKHCLAIETKSHQVKTILYYLKSWQDYIQFDVKI